MKSISNLVNKYKNISAPVKASLWYTVGSVINKGIALFLTPIFTRILTTAQYGAFSIFQSWVNILIIFTSLNIFLSGYQKGLLLYKEDRDRFTSSQLGLTSFITICFFAIYLMNIDFFTRLFDLSPVLMVGMFLELLFMPALEFWAARQRFDYKYKKYVLISVSVSVLSLVLGVVSVISTKYKLEARVFSDVVSKLVFMIPLFILIFSQGKKFFVKEYWKYALVFNLPLIPHYLSNYVLNQSDRLMIGNMVGKSEAAFYSVAYTISTMMMLIVTSVNNSLTPFIYKSIESGEVKNFKKVTAPIIFLMALLCLLTVIFAPEVIYVFAGKKYMDAIYVIPPVAISVFFVFLYSLYSTIEYYYQQTGYIALATTLSAVLNLVLNFIFIKKFGYYAAGYTTLICYVFLSFAHYYFYKKIVREKLHKNSIFNDRLILVISLCITLIMMGLTLTYSNLIVRYLFAILIFVCVFVKRKDIIKIFKTLC